MNTADAVIEAALKPDADLATLAAGTDACLETESEQTESVLRRWICTVPNADFPRLTLAAWWETHGMKDRAEIVRVQIALANLSNPHDFASLNVKSSFDYAADDVREVDQEVSLRGRLLRLLHNNEQQWVKDTFGYIYGKNAPKERQAEWGISLVQRCNLARGFFEEIECPAEYFLERGDYLVLREPLRKVMLLIDPGFVGVIGGSVVGACLMARFPKIQFSVSR